MTLKEKALSQVVINERDFKRVTASMPTAEIERFKEQIVIADRINGIETKELFTAEDSLSDMAAMQGGINRADYGRLTPQERTGVAISDTLPPLPVFKKTMLRKEFDLLDEQQKKETINAGVSVIDSAPRVMDAKDLAAIGDTIRKGLDNGSKEENNPPAN